MMCKIVVMLLGVAGLVGIWFLIGFIEGIWMAHTTPRFRRKIDEWSEYVGMVVAGLLFLTLVVVLVWQAYVALPDNLLWCG